MSRSSGKRREEILRRLVATGHVEARELAESLSVDTSTIRRDLDELARHGHLQRIHGGARIDVVGDVPYAAKRRQNLPAKRAIGQLAASLVGRRQTLLLDSGSTVFEVARALTTREDRLTIITNDLRIAAMLADQSAHRLIVLGGEMLERVYTLVGEEALPMLQRLRADVVFLGADAIESDEITNTNTTEVAVKRKMLEISSHKVLVTDSSKFGHRALAKVAHLDEFDAVITDDALPADWAERLSGRLRIARPDSQAGNGTRDRGSPGI